MAFHFKLQLSDHYEQKGDYGLNIDTDVLLWLDSRDFEKKPPLRHALGFVIVNSQQHDDFDRFKKGQTLYDYNLLESIELLELWHSSSGKKSSDAVVNRFGKQYIKLHITEIDNLCRWVIELRNRFERLGVAAFQIDSSSLQSTSEIILSSHKPDQVAGIEVLPEPPSEKFKEEKACVPERKKGIMLHAAVYINNCKITIADDTVILYRLYKYYHYYGMSLFIP